MKENEEFPSEKKIKASHFQRGGTCFICNQDCNKNDEHDIIGENLCNCYSVEVMI